MNSSGVALGHNRLSILDLSPLGHQPMLSPDGRRVIVYNGEVYNFAEIRRELEQLGHRFRGSGDTEVILAAFAEWGPSAVDKLIGMFAIALWDEERRRLELIRDRLGVKPLYYGWDGRILCFGSELKALRAFSHWQPEIDRLSLGEYLQYGYISNERTIYRGINKLRPGHRLVLSEGNQPEIQSYWSLENALERKPDGKDLEIEEKLESLLIESCRYRMVADVPVGVYLSGGVDSSVVAAILAKHHNQTIRTFTIGFHEDSYDESRWAKCVAEHCGTEHTEYVLRVDEALGIAKTWGTLFDEPFADMSGIPTLLVSRLASEQVKVVLSADGGDELFSGYEVYASVLDRMQQLERIPSPLGRLLSDGLSAVPARLTHNRFMMGIGVGMGLRRLKRLQRMLQKPTISELRDLYLRYWEPEEIRRLVGTYESPRMNADAYRGDPAIQLSLVDVNNYLPEDVLTKVDRTTMAVSIEGREPLLDHRLAEFAISLPHHLRRGDLGPKHLLKKILYRYVPRELVDRPKQGFTIPLEKWLKSDLKELLPDYLNEQRIRQSGVFDPELVTQAVRQFSRGDTSLGAPIWSLLAFEMWRERWL